jgi:hypothetical protein
VYHAQSVGIAFFNQLENRNESLFLASTLSQLTPCQIKAMAQPAKELQVDPHEKLMSGGAPLNHWKWKDEPLRRRGDLRGRSKHGSYGDTSRIMEHLRKTSDKKALKLLANCTVRGRTSPAYVVNTVSGFTN